MGVLESAHIYGVQIRESANDGSDFSNADTDYRILFVGEDGLFHLKDSAGSVTTPTGMADPMTTRGDIIVRNSSNVTARLATGAAGTVLRGGTDPSYGFPPGYELDYVEKTSDTSVTATSEATADTVVTGSAVAYDGSTIVQIQFGANYIQPDQAAAARSISVWLYDGSSSIGRMTIARNDAAAAFPTYPVYATRRLTPSAATHTYSIRASVSAGTGTIGAGAGGNGNAMPGYIRIVRV